MIMAVAAKKIPQLNWRKSAMIKFISMSRAPYKPSMFVNVKSNALDIL